jgi:histidyl-tRNA synthetase
VMDKIERLRKEQIDELASRPEAFAPASVSDLVEISGIRGWENLNRELQAAGLSQSGAHLKETYEALDAMGLAEFVELDLTIVRGLAYYTGVVFEVFDARRTLRAICGGGRYDNLLDAVGGVQLPAAGFGMGDVVLAELLREKGRLPAAVSSIDVFLAFITREDLPHVLALAHQLRDAGLRVEYALTPQVVGKQFKLADSRNVSLAVVLGPDERLRGEAVIKDLRSGSQESVSLHSIQNTIKARMNG